MPSRPALAALFVFTACSPDFATLDEACHETVPGARHATGDAEDTVFRVNCHRRIAGIGRLRVQPQVQAAADDQARAGMLRPVGEVMQSLRDANYAFASTDGFGLWTMMAGSPDALEPAERVDAIMTIPYFRQVLLQPSSRHVGAAQQGDLLSMVLTYDYPPFERAARGVVYPADGQQDVPTTWTTLMEGVDGIPSGDVGYPITITVTGDTDQAFGTLDPHALALADVSLEGPAGDVEVVVVLPSTTQVLLTSTAMIVPLAPLEPDADYLLTARVTWSNGARNLETTFATAP